MIGYGNQMYAQPQQVYQQPTNNGLISVRNEYEARNYPTAHGASLTFKDENAPYLYTKTLGFSQMDVPVFEKFRLIRETESPQNESQMSEANDSVSNNLENEIGQIKGQIDSIKKNVKELLDFKAEFGGDSDAE